MRIKSILKRLGSKKKRKFVPAVMLTFHILGLVSTIDSLMTTRTTQGTIAWAVSLNTFPYLAVPGYWIFGRTRFNGYVTAWQASDGEMEYIATAMIEEVGPYRFTEFEKPKAARVAELLAETPVLGGNSVELLIDGEATFEEEFGLTGVEGNGFGCQQFRDETKVALFVERNVQVIALPLFVTRGPEYDLNVD